MVLTNRIARPSGRHFGAPAPVERLVTRCASPPWAMSSTYICEGSSPPRRAPIGAPGRRADALHQPDVLVGDGVAGRLLGRGREGRHGDQGQGEHEKAGPPREISGFG